MILSASFVRWWTSLEALRQYRPDAPRGQANGLHRGVARDAELAAVAAAIDGVREGAPAGGKPNTCGGLSLNALATVARRPPRIRALWAWSLTLISRLRTAASSSRGAKKELHDEDDLSRTHCLGIA